MINNNNTIISKVFIEDKELIDSGLINLACDSLMIEVQNLKFELAFEKTPENKSYYEGSVVNQHHMKLSFYNFNNALLSGIIEPIEVGTIQNRKLYFSISGLASGRYRVLFYNILLSKEVINEKNASK